MERVVSNIVMTGFFLSFFIFAGYNFVVGNTLAAKLEKSFEMHIKHK